MDDFRDSNPASNDELLDGQTSAFVEDGSSLKGLIRTILRSRTYQLSSHTNELNADDDLYFSHALTKLLPAEVLLDAISTVTGTTTAFEGLPQGARVTQMPDGKDGPPGPTDSSHQAVTPQSSGGIRTPRWRPSGPV